MSDSTNRTAILVGGSIAALGTALALSRQSYHVICLEQDSASLPHSLAHSLQKDPEAVWRDWQRRGAPQIRHSHVLLAPLVQLLKTHVPEFYQCVLDHGAEELKFADMVRNIFADPEFVDSDNEITFLACRRVIFEYLLRQYISDTTSVELRNGVRVTGLHRKGDQVAGVMIDGSSEPIPADVVVDASGRFSKAPEWLTAAGFGAPEQESAPCGIFYTSKFYQLADGADYPAMDGRRAMSGAAQGVDLGYMKVGLFRSDNRTFSITLAADPEDADMRPITRQRTFDIAAASIDATRDWVDPSVSRPISKVFLYGNLHNARRHYHVDGKSIAPGFFAVGDALIHTNPIAGRGCSLAWVSGFGLADALAASLETAATAYASFVETNVTPWYHSQVQQDQQAMEVNQAMQRGEDPFAFTNADGTIDEARQRRVIFRKGLGHASKQHLDVLRKVFRQVNLLDLPQTLLRDQELIAKVLAGYQIEKDNPLEIRPSRDEMLQLFQNGGA